MASESQPEDLTSKSPPEGGGGDKGKQRRTDVDVEAEQSKLSEERKRKGRVNEGDDRFSKKSKNEEAVESKKFDVSEDELGMDFVQDCVGKENANECTQRDTVVRGVGWKTRWQTMLIAWTCSNHDIYTMRFTSCERPRRFGRREMNVNEVMSSRLVSVRFLNLPVLQNYSTSVCHSRHSSPPAFRVRFTRDDGH
jgi:hypothetical protein